MYMRFLRRLIQFIFMSENFIEIEDYLRIFFNRTRVNLLYELDRLIYELILS